MEALQTQFIKSQGKPVKIGDDIIVQIDIISLKKGFLTLTFKTENKSIPSGIAIKSNKGYIKLADGRKEKLVYVWNKADLPKKIIYEVFASDEQIKIWNIYQISPSSPIQADCWTNNAGMVIDVINENKKIYYCSDGLGPFDKSKLVFEIEWKTTE